METIYPIQKVSQKHPGKLKYLHHIPPIGSRVKIRVRVRVGVSVRIRVRDRDSG